MRVSLPENATGRVGIGLLQGGTLLLLNRAFEQKDWPATNGVLFTALTAVAIFIPVLLISGLGNLRPRTMIAWAAVATIISAGLGAYDIARDPVLLSGVTETPRIIPYPTTWLCMAAILFIVHTLTVAGEADHRLVATYPTHFDVSWKHGVQFVLAICFVAVFWGVLYLGAALFSLIHIEFFATLIRTRTFAIPANAIAFCCAVHVTDVRANIVQGARNLLLILLAWLLPLMALIAAAFVVALAFTGLTPLWGTKRAASILLIAAAALIFLINAAHQDGRAEERTAAVLRYAKVVAAISIVPLTALAAYALYLRIAQYGWTPDRIIATACVVVAAFYAAGYMFAAAQAGASMKALEGTNFVTALVIVGVLLALRSPIADPARISVADQMRRLQSGQVTPERFDFSFLRFGAGRFGAAALDQLATNAQGPQAAAIAERANQALHATAPYQIARGNNPVTPDMRARNITVVQPSGATLPDRFLQQDWKTMQRQFLLPRCLVTDAKCEAILTDLDGDGQPEILLLSLPAGSVTAFKADSSQVWEYMGSVTNTYCAGVREALRAGRFATEMPAVKDIVVDGQHLRINELNGGCNPKPAAAQRASSGVRSSP